MSQPLSKFARQSLIYGLAGIASSLVSFALTPMYARYLGPAGFGRLEILLACAQLLMVLGTFGAGSAVVMLTTAADDQPPGMLGSALAVVATCGLIGLLVTAGAATALGSVLHLPAAWIRQVALLGLLMGLGQIFLAMWRGRGQAWILAGVTSLQVALTLAANIYQVAWHGRGVAGILDSLVVVQAITCLGSLVIFRRELTDGVTWTAIRRVMAYGYPHVLSGIAVWLMVMGDRFFLSTLVSPTELGQYTLANKLSQLAQLALTAPLTLAWPAFISQMHRDPAAAPQFGRLCERLVAYAGGLFLLIALPAPEWVQLIGGNNYGQSASLVPILALAVILSAFQPIAVTGLGLAMKVHLYPVVTWSAALGNLGLNLLLIPTWGTAGAAWATLAAYATALAVGWTVSQRAKPLVVPWGRLAALTAWAAFVWGLSITHPSLGWRVAVSLIYVAGACWLTFKPRPLPPIVSAVPS